MRQQITEGQLGALYEMDFLTVFGHWENFIEDCTVRMLAGQGCPSYVPTIAAPPKSPSLTAARTRLLNGRRFLLWYDPKVAADRIAGHVTGSPLELALRGAETGIGQMAGVRHAIAHQPQDALASFSTVSAEMVGVVHSSPGDLLRSLDHSDPLNPRRWLRRLTSDLRILGIQATA
ncbi:hypothetical protein N1031_19875 [Herbiconiux moechotypicola]|uniref:AbiEi antitoxin C-terminal domain-containing protein n=1 Tax=Herbiconiux moechotypicola TaxID=637393 RepID=A0ABP5R2R6_9MICO|nr:hypothetical protein [Herbiconiux moechotypicola]MCS5732021.1 hypothetical protein [Herbiconiux moechotypicola]